MKTFLNPLSILNIISGCLHRGDIIRAVEVLKDLPWQEQEKNADFQLYNLLEIGGIRNIFSGKSDTLILTLREYKFLVKETKQDSFIKVSSTLGYKMEKHF